MDDQKPPVIAIVGPTASGKTALSIALAKRFDGEVISADSRQVYRGMDIGTAKVTKEEMDGIPHHLIDICEPTDVYTGADFAKDGGQAISEILGRNKLPIVAGGTFFFLDLLKGSVIAPAVPPNYDLRAELEVMTNEELMKRLLKLDSITAERIDRNNPRRLVRAIEIATALGHVPPSDPTPSPYRWLTLGIDVSLEELTPRLHSRVIERLDLGMIEEVEMLHKNGVSWERLDSFGLEYRYIAKYLQNEIDKETMINEITVKSRQFAKRQKTWLKRDLDIVWLPFPPDQVKAELLVQEFLASKGAS